MLKTTDIFYLFNVFLYCKSIKCCYLIALACLKDRLKGGLAALHTYCNPIPCNFGTPVW